MLTEGTTDPVIVGTRTGSFKCHQVFAFFILKTIFPNARLIRSRLIEETAPCDILIDTGNRYFHPKHRYDHKSPAGNTTMTDLEPQIHKSLRLTCAGMVYHHYGRNVIKKLIHEMNPNETLNEHKLEFLFTRTYYHLVKEIDGIGSNTKQRAIEKATYLTNTHIGNRIRSFNMYWNDPDPINFNHTAAFYRASDYMKVEFTDIISRLSRSIYQIKEVLREAINNRFKTHPTGEIVLLDMACPWKKFLFELENEMELQNSLKFIIHKQPNSKHYYITAIPIDIRSLDRRIYFPFDWRGKEGDVLSNMAEIDGCVSVHFRGQIAIHTTKDGALKMAIKSLEFQKIATAPPP